MDAAVVARVVTAVERDLASGRWDARHGALRALTPTTPACDSSSQLMERRHLPRQAGVCPCGALVDRTNLDRAEAGGQPAPRASRASSRSRARSGRSRRSAPWPRRTVHRSPDVARRGPERSPLRTVCSA
jgi:hypothetical protein